MWVKRWWPFGQQSEAELRPDDHLRQALLTVAEAVRASLARERSDADAVEELVHRLHAAAAEESLESSRRTVRQTADHLLRLLVQREGRQQVLADYVASLVEKAQTHRSQGP
jgi:glucose-6-phosphate-specific signal transduction histidine kinase